MALYALSLTQGQDSIQQDEMVELDDDDAAWEEAATAFGEVILDLDLDEAGAGWIMDVKRASGELVYRLQFSVEAYLKK